MRVNQGTPQAWCYPERHLLKSILLKQQQQQNKTSKEKKTNICKVTGDY